MAFRPPCILFEVGILAIVGPLSSISVSDLSSSSMIVLIGVIFVPVGLLVLLFALFVALLRLALLP